MLQKKDTSFGILMKEMFKQLKTWQDLSPSFGFLVFLCPKNTSLMLQVLPRM
jgi:hypothetical protein